MIRVVWGIIFSLKNSDSITYYISKILRGGSRTAGASKMEHFVIIVTASSR